MRFAPIAGVACLALSCAEPERATPARAAPWVEFMRAEQVTGWLDTSRLAGRGPVEALLSMDYATPLPVTDDTAVKYTRMDWRVGLDCAAGRVRDRGISLYDASGTEVKRWAGDESWAAIEGHPTGTALPWACRTLRRLGR